MSSRGNVSVVRSAEYFWNTSILNISEDFNGLAEFHWPSVIGLVVMWTIIYLCLWKGIKLTSRVAVFTALFPYLPMVALFIRGMTLEGAWFGLRYYLIPDLQRLLNRKAWIQAAGKIRAEAETHRYSFVLAFKDTSFGPTELDGVSFLRSPVTIDQITIFIVI